MFFVLFLYLECCILFKKVKTRLFNRYLFSIFCVVAIAVILVTLLIFTIYANLQVSSARTYSVHQLEQVCQMTDMLYSQMRSVNNQILQNSNTNRCLSSNTFNRLIEADAGIKLREIQTAQSYTRYVSLYNSASNRFVSSSTADFLTDDDITYYYSRLPDNPGADTCLLRMIGANYATQQLKTRYVYSFVFRAQLRKGGSPDLIIVDVDEDYFNDSISNLRTSSGFQQVLLLNRYGEVFSTNIAEGDSKTFTHAKSDNTIVSVEDFPELTDNSGSFSYTYADHTEALVTYAKASSSGFTIFNIVPYSNIYSGLPQLAIITLLAGILVLCIGMFISFRTSAKLSAPIEVLYNNYVKKPLNDHAGDELDQLSKAFSDMYMKADKLEQGLISSYSDSKKRNVQRLMHGEYGQIPNYIEVYQSYGIDLTAPYYTIVIISAASKELRFGPDDPNYFIYSYALENLATEVLGQFGSVVPYRNSHNFLVMLLPLQKNAYPEKLVPELERVCEVMQREFAMKTTICIGTIVETAVNINLCYEATNIALEYSAIRNQGKIFFAYETGQNINLNSYHNKLHMKLAEHIRANDLDACSHEFDLALSYMSNVSFNTAVTYFNHVMMSLLDDFSTTFTDDDTAYPILMDKLNEIDRQLPNVYMLRKRCMEFITILAHHQSINRKYGNELAADAAKEYIDKNYANPDLSLKMLASMAGLSSAYFGKIFATQIGYSFSDYLSNTRMKKAEQLLRETKLPINQISEAIGIVNTNYFYSIFKKKYGMTPLAYRRTRSGEAEDTKSEEQDETTE